jgi:hypothetical protein
MLSSVVLPQPEWPMMVTNSPLSTRRLTSLSTSVCTEPRAKVLPM